MRLVGIREKEAGQRLDKYLRKYLKEAPDSFLYKMLRRKNITWNGKKASGSEKLEIGDEIRFFLSEETLIKFGGGPAPIFQEKENVKRTAGSLPGDTAGERGESGGKGNREETGESGETVAGETVFETEYARAFQKYGELEIIYEDKQLLLVNKPAGILTQKAKKEDLSLNEWLIGYLLAKGELAKEELHTFKPSVCNRLDRNTSGTVLCGKTLKGSQELSRLLKERSLQKYYLAYVKGQVNEASHLEGILIKEEAANRVSVRRKEPGADQERTDSCRGGQGRTGERRAGQDRTKQERTDRRKMEGSYIQTRYEPLKSTGDRTLLKVELITGKTHQIRAHLSSIGHPVIGDYKYGDLKCNDRYKKRYGVKSQLLHAWMLTFPVMEGEFKGLSGRTFSAIPPEIFRILEAEQAGKDAPSETGN